MMSEILKIHKMLINKEISATELTQKYISRIESCNSDINAFISMDFENAYLTADMIDSKIKRNAIVSVLAAVPVSIKDNISVKGLKMTCASKMLDNYVSPYDATVVYTLKSLDAVILGKNNMDEFAMGSTGETSYYGKTANPLNKSKVPGGSSCGSAAAVASGMSVYSLASDTGGSVRLPASYCGVVGFKPSYGMISRYGLTAYASSFDQVGIIAGNVTDVSLVYDNISTPDANDMTCVSKGGIKSFDSLKADISGVRIGVDYSYINRADTDIQNRIYELIGILESSGAIIVPINLPSLDLILASYYITACAEAASNLSRYDGVRYGYRPDRYISFDDMVTKSRTDGFGSEVKKRIILGNLILSSGYHNKYYVNSYKCRNSLICDINSIFSNVDVILTPTSPEKVPDADKTNPSIDDMYLLDIYTVLANLCELPAISIPCGYDSNNMPIGIQFMSAKFDDSKLLSVSYSVEKELNKRGGGIEWL